LSASIFDGSVAGVYSLAARERIIFCKSAAGGLCHSLKNALVGLKVGERDTIQVTYPENYPNKEIAGKLVDFFIVIRELKQKVLPELDDDFAKDYGECASLDEHRSKIRSRLEEELTHYQDEELKEQLLNRVIEKHSVTPPPAMVERQTRYLMERYDEETRTRRFLTRRRCRQLKRKKSLEGRAARQIQATLLVEKISQQEKIEVSDHEVQERIESLARAAGERSKTVRDYYGKAEAREDLRAQIVFDRTLSFLLERSQIKEVDPPPPKV
jgi:trigger factor